MRQLELLEDGGGNLPPVPAASVCVAFEASDEPAPSGDPFGRILGAPFCGFEQSPDRCSVHATANGLKTSRADRIFSRRPHI
ncbi:MAG: hypothetical protein J0J01_29085 [Reyranella sp.]|uniref:hypothetical protein n=1 Tax=Reyranella sp. TaxID=1929291 RepID=UPI001AC23D37|nr:hypothetical protein [Reyranella sp.]MBN9090988.1 hypothetical protein [Reyranella sp.]